MVEAEVQRQGGSPTCASHRVLGKNAALSGESDHPAVRPHCPSREPQLRCPECGSKRVVHAGFRELFDGTQVQRWQCKDCERRFSEKGPQGPSGRPKAISDWHLKAGSSIEDDRQVCVALARGARNLAEVETRQEKPMREGTRDLPGTLLKDTYDKTPQQTEQFGRTDISFYRKLISLEHE
jgi:hypothetical protein